jgi:alkanesulfonate monooxygenase SsuD/methylene tetrahydromethanopterin reductase-like flavin-dependent oxidoreductase (luciferase family)
MRFHFFHLMSYPHLPSDFTTKYRSVWVDPPNRQFDPKAGHVMYNEYLDELEFAAEVGFDSVCVNEHHQNAYGLMPSPNLIASTLARSTKDVAIAVLGNSIALYNPPVRVAEEMAMLDVLSGGRLISGFPIGTSMDTNYCYGLSPAILREKYYEAHELILKAWTEPDPFIFNGKYTQLRYVNIWPRPLQQPHPPIWIPGGGSVETWAWTAERDYLYAYVSFSGYKHAERVLQGYWETCDQLGVDRNPYRAAFVQICAVGETDAEAEELYAEHLEYLYQKSLHINPGFADAPGYRTIKSIEAGLAHGFGRGTQEARSHSWKDFMDSGILVAGSPATVRDQLRDVVKRLGLGHLLVLLQFGNMPKEKALHSTRLFATEVAPQLREEFSFPEWEDRWYPKTLVSEEPAGLAR